MKSSAILKATLLATILILACASAYGQCGEYSLKWEVDYGAQTRVEGIHRSETQIGSLLDFDGDSHPDLWCTVDSVYTVIDGENGSILYELPQLQWANRWTCAGIGQADDDESYEVLFSFNGKGYDANPSYPDTLVIVDIQTGARCIIRVSGSADERFGWGLGLVDIDNDGRDEIVGVEGTVLFCYDHDVASAVGDISSEVLPQHFAVSQNYPNPFNPSTTIEYDIPRHGQVVLTIYNINGQVVDIPVNEVQSAGNHQVVWDGCDSGGSAVASGVYFYRIEAGDHIGSKKMVLLK